MNGEEKENSKQEEIKGKIVVTLRKIFDVIAHVWLFIESTSGNDIASGAQSLDRPCIAWKFTHGSVHVLVERMYEFDDLNRHESSLERIIS
jgi:hypothetical protein